jgi:hypothetical protein
MFHFGQFASMCRFGTRGGLISSGLNAAQAAQAPHQQVGGEPGGAALEALRTGIHGHVFGNDPDGGADDLAGDH